jgi:ABC-type glutathione transport system ATPase component
MILTAHDVALSYARVRRFREMPPPVVTDVSFEVPKGRTLGIVGESGSGKSTLARAIVGLLPVAAGELRFDGEPLPAKRPAELRRRIQMVFQDPSSSLNPALDIGRMLIDYVPGAGRSRRRGRVDELLELVGLSHGTTSKRPSELSGGERQRVAIARALAGNPDVLVADEPTSALDVSVQATIINLLRRIQEEVRLTIVFISHDLGVVQSVADEVLVLLRGRVVEYGEATQVLESPSNPYTAELIASAPALR